jgi:NAD(P)-dependent dehydrogenase (short-subunit alcohol dehydrogenase family)
MTTLTATTLTDHVALVTGAGHGIGKACAMALAAAGAAVVATDIDGAAADAVARSITGSGGRALALCQDVTHEATWGEVIAAVDARFARLDILIANAGIAIAGPLIDMTLEAWRRQQAVNVEGVFLSLKHGIPAIRRGGRGGSIVLMSSVAGLRGAANLAGYSASKGAVRLLAKSAALECAAAGDGIRVNSVHPGIIDTDIWKKMPQGPVRGANDVPDPHALAAVATPLGKAGVPDDIAQTVVFLASDTSRYVTGAEFVVDGGMTAGALRRGSPRP